MGWLLENILYRRRNWIEGVASENLSENGNRKGYSTLDHHAIRQLWVHRPAKNRSRPNGEKVADIPTTGNGVLDVVLPIFYRRELVGTVRVRASDDDAPVGTGAEIHLLRLSYKCRRVALLQLHKHVGHDREGSQRLVDFVCQKVLEVRVRGQPRQRLAVDATDRNGVAFDVLYNAVHSGRNILRRRSPERTPIRTCGVAQKRQLRNRLIRVDEVAAPVVGVVLVRVHDALEHQPSHAVRKHGRERGADDGAVALAEAPQLSVGRSRSAGQLRVRLDEAEQVAGHRGSGDVVAERRVRLDRRVAPLAVDGGGVVLFLERRGRYIGGARVVGAVKGCACFGVVPEAVELRAASAHAPGLEGDEVVRVAKQTSEFVLVGL
ncbi:uncharacterized protein PG998_010465 [Apiospora kogelbergensis]|uniref:uncharacterized protein n=1 Tax=Apiospora kogelbergensis TaxID=1337665 RepID=UPI00312E29E5